jgi:hypothetical protein
LWRFKYEPGITDGILPIHRNWYHIIEIGFAHNTKEENIKT